MICLLMHREVKDYHVRSNAYLPFAFGIHLYPSLDSRYTRHYANVLSSLEQTDIPQCEYGVPCPPYGSVECPCHTLTSDGQCCWLGAGVRHVRYGALDRFQPVGLGVCSPAQTPGAGADGSGCTTIRRHGIVWASCGSNSFAQ